MAIIEQMILTRVLIDHCSIMHKRFRFFQQNVCNNKKKICEQIYKRKLNRQG